MLFRSEALKWKKANPEKVKEYARHNYARNRAKFCARSKRNYQRKPEIWLRSDLKKRYNLSLEKYRSILARQGGVCAICGEQERAGWRRLSVDHDHETMKVRGLLCRRCNSSIGLLKDNPELLKRAIQYLESSEAKDGHTRHDDK